MAAEGGGKYSSVDTDATLLELLCVSWLDLEFEIPCELCASLLCVDHGAGADVEAPAEETSAARPVGFQEDSVELCVCELLVLELTNISLGGGSFVGMPRLTGGSLTEPLNTK